MTIKSKLKTFFFLDEEYDDQNEDYVEEPIPVPVKQQRPQPVKTQNVVSLQSVQKSSSSKVVLLEPRAYSEAPEIADHLKSKRSVVVNLQRIDKEQARQIVDFLSGAVYAIGGDIQKVGLDIFLCTPDNVEVSGNISEFMHENNIDDSRW
jgi:cell division inhibitor SepF